jgi:stage III sporulation protein AE
MTTALAAQGGGGSAAALYAGTAMFDALLSAAMERLLVPLVYVFLALSLLSAATGSTTIAGMKKGLYQFTTKGLRIVLYIFTGYLTVTGVVGGSADQMQLKAAKLTISGMVPVVGNIMADASETILVSAGLVKSAVGIYGLLAITATAMIPSLNVGIRYLLIKATAAAAGLLGGKEDAELIGDFGAAMGLLLAITLTQTLLLMISTVCFMKGMG